MSLDLPAHEHTVSTARLDDQNLFVRFIADYHVGAAAAAFELYASNVVKAEEVLAYLQRAQSSDDYLYVFERGGRVVVSSDERGDEVEIEAQAIQSRSDRPNADELTRFLAQARQLYEQQRYASSTSFSRLQAVQDLLHEQLRRLEVKASSHAPGTTPAVLYAQNIQFLRLLLGMTEA